MASLCIELPRIVWHSFASLTFASPHNLAASPRRSESAHRSAPPRARVAPARLVWPRFALHLLALPAFTLHLIALYCIAVHLLSLNCLAQVEPCLARCLATLACLVALPCHAILCLAGLVLPSCVVCLAPPCLALCKSRPCLALPSCPALPGLPMRCSALCCYSALHCPTMDWVQLACMLCFTLP